VGHFYRISGTGVPLRCETPRAVVAPPLSLRALNRTLLARQMLLTRVPCPPGDAVTHLVGMQAQEPQAPYLGLWSRLSDFDPGALSSLLAERQLVRAGLMRVTLHLVSAEDYRVLWPMMRDTIAAAFAGGPFARRLGGARVDEVVAAGQAVLAAEPHTRAELGRVLADRWPDAEPDALAMAATMHTPVVQTPPRGLWRASGQARWTPAAEWLGSPVDGRADPAPIIRRYLRAFGPATVADIAAWSGLSGVRALVGDDLVRRRDEAGRELLDVPDAPLPDPDTPAPPRFLAPFDNAILAHADRRRIIAAEHRPRVFADRLMRTFLLDGFVAGTWAIRDGALTLDPFGALTDELLAEAERVAAFLEVSPPLR
jgi:hypothetical protein